MSNNVNATDTGLVAPYTVKKGETKKTTDIPPRGPKTDLDKNAFLNLLITQMKYQDPLNPVEDKEFLAQMAQFTSLEQMQNLNKSQAQAQGYSLIGKTVFGKSYQELTNTYLEVEGRVNAVTMKNNETYLLVGKTEMKLSEVTDVYEDFYQSNMMQSINNNLNNAQNIALVGKTVQAITMNKDMKPTGFVEGKVDFIKFGSDGAPILVVGDKEVYPQEVVSISDDTMLIGKPASANILDVDGSGTYKDVSGTIKDILIVGDQIKVVIKDSTGKEYQAHVDKIDKVTDALRMVGKTITYTDTTGEVKGILIKNKKVYVLVGDDKKEVLFDDVKPKG